MELFKYKQAAFLVASICLKMLVKPNSLEIPRTAGLIFQVTSLSELSDPFLKYLIYTFCPSIHNDTILPCLIKNALVTDPAFTVMFTSTTDSLWNNCQ